MKNFVFNQLSEFILLHALALLLGFCVSRYRLKVNYSRKVFHFFVFFSPYLFRLVFPFHESFFTQIMIALIGLATLGIYVKPLRRRFRIVTLMFAAFDRPEDRPHTLKWLFTQYLATYLVAIPLWLLFSYMGHPEVLPMIILINAVGDGLAEPVGIAWGKHKYRVRAFFTSRVYTRSLEGSACVLVTALVVVVAFSNHFSLAQRGVSLFCIPAVATLAEARSPHTWDSPFIFLFTGAAFAGVFMI